MVDIPSNFTAQLTVTLSELERVYAELMGLTDRKVELTQQLASLQAVCDHQFKVVTDQPDYTVLECALCSFARSFSKRTFD